MSNVAVERKANQTAFPPGAPVVHHRRTADKPLCWLICYRRRHGMACKGVQGTKFDRSPPITQPERSQGIVGSALRRPPGHEMDGTLVVAACNTWRDVTKSRGDSVAAFDTAPHAASPCAAVTMRRLGDIAALARSLSSLGASSGPRNRLLSSSAAAAGQPPKDDGWIPPAPKFYPHQHQWHDKYCRQKRIMPVGPRFPALATDVYVAPSAVVAGDVDILDGVRLAKRFEGAHAHAHAGRTYAR